MKRYVSLALLLMVTAFAVSEYILPPVFSSAGHVESESVEIDLLALQASDDLIGYAIPASGVSDPCPQVCTGAGRGETCTRGVSNQGDSCTSSPNACGMINTGVIQCTGACSADTPSDSLCAPTCVSNQGDSCSSAANSCGMTNSGTIQCNGSCNATTPSDSACGSGCVSNQGNSCSSAANSCGMTNSGTIQCNGSCNATTPSESACPQVVSGCTDSSARNYNPNANTNDGSCVYYPPMPTVQIDAENELVRSEEEFDITWDPNGWLGNCQLLPTAFFSSQDANTAGSAQVSVTAKTEFVYRCTAAAGVYAAGPRSSEVEVEVEVVPAVQEI